MHKLLSGLGSVCLTLVSLHAEQVRGLSLHIQKPAPGVVRLWLGDTGNATATVAIATRKGVVVVDTVGMPAVDRELRKVIARELGRSDFTMLINTHEHADHTLGNEAYADCTIVAHEACGRGMKAQQAFLPDWIRFGKERIHALERELATNPEPAKAKGLQEELTMTRLNLEAYDRVRLTLPTQTFQDRLSLNMGDTTFELYALGGLHSDSDIAIHVPERGLILTGDTMADAWLTEAPGCLASFGVRPGSRPDFPRLFKNWAALDALGKGTLLPGHWNATLSWKGFRERVAYFQTVHSGVQALIAAEQPMVSIFREFPLRSRFPELSGAPGITPQTHQMTLIGTYAALTGTTSAAQAIDQLASRDADEGAIQEVLAEQGRKGARHFFLEGEFNAMGYRHLQAQATSRALTLFKACARAFPESWNAHDSLAEAYTAAGQKDLAITHYERSLALNPKNRNGEERLQRLRAEAR